MKPINGGVQNRNGNILAVGRCLLFPGIGITLEALFFGGGGRWGRFVSEEWTHFSEEPVFVRGLPIGAGISKP